MKPSIYGMTETDVFRLVVAFTAVRDPATRSEFLRTIEAWPSDQWSGN